MPSPGPSGNLSTRPLSGSVVGDTGLQAEPDHMHLMGVGQAGTTQG